MVESKKLDKFKPGLLRQELVSYEILKGNLYKKYIGGSNEYTNN